jgi:ATP-dependent RNA helicase DDX5/DBP2
VYASLAIGGESKGEQLRPHQAHGSHVLVGTPGRVLDFFKSGDYKCEQISLLVLDEGDRMLDDLMGGDVRALVQLFPPVRQTLVFSATMPDAVRMPPRSLAWGSSARSRVRRRGRCSRGSR